MESTHRTRIKGLYNNTTNRDIGKTFRQIIFTIVAASTLSISTIARPEEAQQLYSDYELLCNTIGEEYKQYEGAEQTEKARLDLIRAIEISLKKKSKADRR